MEKKIKKAKLSDLIPYENNPRINDDAVDAVKKSIEQCGYIAPIIVDENMIVLAGHTRLKAMQELGNKTCEIMQVFGMNETEKKKYRLLDNKTNEMAKWDFDKLKDELDGIDFEDLEIDWGIDFEEEVEENIYEEKTIAPQYEICGENPKINEVFDNTKCEFLIDNIEQSNVSEDEKLFLISAAYRHCVINFEKVAEYYANASKEMQELMEQSALVIVDYDDAIRNGYVVMSEKLEEIMDGEI